MRLDAAHVADKNIAVCIKKADIDLSVKHETVRNDFGTRNWHPLRPFEGYLQVRRPLFSELLAVEQALC